MQEVFYRLWGENINCKFVVDMYVWVNVNKCKCSVHFLMLYIDYADHFKEKCLDYSVVSYKAIASLLIDTPVQWDYYLCTTRQAHAFPLKWG